MKGNKETTRKHKTYQLHFNELPFWKHQTFAGMFRKFANFGCKANCLHMLSYPRRKCYLSLATSSVQFSKIKERHSDKSLVPVDQIFKALRMLLSWDTPNSEGSWWITCAHYTGEHYEDTQWQPFSWRSRATFATRFLWEGVCEPAHSGTSVKGITERVGVQQSFLSSCLE